MKSFEEYGYVIKNGVLAFIKGPLSNFWGGFKGQGKQPQFSYDGRNYICNEQFYMMMKAHYFGDYETEDILYKETNPHNHQKIGQTVKRFNIDEWNSVKFIAMKIGLICKFGQNDDLAEFLLSTGGLILVEAAPWDKSWGCGTGYDDERTFQPENWQGENLLGKALMKVRQDLRDNSLLSFKTVE